MTADELLSMLEARPMERLRWRVLRRFGVLPGSRRARALTDAEVLICGAHMVLDLLPRPGALEAEAGRSDFFDEGRFDELSGEGL